MKASRLGWLVLTLALDTLVAGSLHASKALPQGRPSLNWDKYLQQPTFDEANRQKVVAAEGSTAFLHCKINHLADRAVTWIRKADVQVLTVNSYTYTTDPRFTAHSSADADEWVLKITSARLEDSGGYECQVSTETKMSTTFELEVIVAFAEISGAGEVFMNSGGNLDLSCSVARVTDPPEFVLWYHGKTVINYSDREGVLVSMSRSGKKSRLLIRKAETADSGNYTCQPSNAKPASATVHIVKEKRPEAMQHEDSGTSLSCSLLSVLFASLITMVVQSLQIKDQELCKPAQPTECSLSKAETITLLSTNKSNVLHWEGNAQEVQKSLEVSVRSKELSQFTKSTTTLISCKDKFE